MPICTTRFPGMPPSISCRTGEPFVAPFSSVSRTSWWASKVINASAPAPRAPPTVIELSPPITATGTSVWARIARHHVLDVHLELLDGDRDRAGHVAQVEDHQPVEGDVEIARIGGEAFQRLADRLRREIALRPGDGAARVRGAEDDEARARPRGRRRASRLRDGSSGRGTWAAWAGRPGGRGARWTDPRCSSYPRARDGPAGGRRSHRPSGAVSFMRRNTTHGGRGHRDADRSSSSHPRPPPRTPAERARHDLHRPPAGLRSRGSSNAPRRRDRRSTTRL